MTYDLGKPVSFFLCTLYIYFKNLKITLFNCKSSIIENKDCEETFNTINQFKRRKCIHHQKVIKTAQSNIVTLLITGELQGKKSDNDTKSQFFLRK